MSYYIFLERIQGKILAYLLTAKINKIESQTPQVGRSCCRLLKPAEDDLNWLFCFVVCTCIVRSIVTLSNKNFKFPSSHSL